MVDSEETMAAVTASGLFFSYCAVADAAEITAAVAVEMTAAAAN